MYIAFSEAESQLKLRIPLPAWTTNNAKPLATSTGQKRGAFIAMHKTTASRGSGRGICSYSILMLRPSSMQKSIAQ